MKIMLSSLALSIGLLATTGSDLAATPCTSNYVRCLNDSADWWAPARLLADFACFDSYTSCVYWRIIAV